MNKAVRLWNKHQSRLKYNGPDAVETEEGKFIMAERQNVDGVVLTLPTNQFNNVIRLVGIGSLDKVRFLRSACYENIKRLGLKHDLSKAVRGVVPEGSDQFDTGSIVSWMKKITPKDKQAKKQLIAIDATACARLTLSGE